MEPARFQRIATLFGLTVDLPRAEWRAHLAQLCPDDPSLIDDTFRLLMEDAGGDSPLGEDVAQLAHQLLAYDIADAGDNRTVGPYRLKRFLGEGGMGVVYLAEREDLGSTVAIKLLRDAWLSPARRERFAQEQQTLAQMQHPLIARLYDAGTLADGTPWIAMEYVEGEPITQYCREASYTVEERLRLLRRVCDAVQYAHGRAIIHRDLKPGNILATADASIRLLDFGIARYLDEDAQLANRTQTGLRMMTPAWAAPEMLRGDPAGVQCDVYSLGVILYELLTGKLPASPGSPPPGVVNAGPEQGLPQRPSASVGDGGCAELSRTAWADLDVLCLTAIHPDTGRRYPSVEAFARDIDHYLGQEALDARPDSALYRMRKFGMRNRRTVVAASIALCAVTLLAGAFTWRLSLARDEAAAEAARAQRVQSFLFQLLQGGDEYAGPAQELRVVSLLERGVQEARALGSNPSMQADLFENLGGVYQKLGELPRAEELLQAALVQRKSLLGDEHPDTARAMVALCLLRIDQARLQEAEQLAREALGIIQRALPASHPDEVRARSALGSVLIEQGDYAGAIAVLTTSANRAAQRGTNESEDAERLLLLANAHFYAGDYDASAQLNRSVLDIRTRIMGANHPAVANVLVNLGAISFEKSNLDEAEELYREALRIHEDWFGEHHPSTASVLTILGRALVRAERYDEATAALQRSVAIQEAVHGPSHPAVASVGNELATIALLRGDHAEAERGFQRVAAIYRDLHGDTHFLNGVAMSNLGSVALAKNDLPLATIRFREAIRVFLGSLDARHLNVGIARLKLGRTLLRAGRYAEAEEEIRQGRAVVLERAGNDSAWLAAADADLAQLPKTR